MNERKLIMGRTLLVHRKKRLDAYKVTYTLVVDGQEFGKLKNGETLRVDISEESHEIFMRRKVFGKNVDNKKCYIPEGYDHVVCNMNFRYGTAFVIPVLEIIGYEVRNIEGTKEIREELKRSYTAFLLRSNLIRMFSVNSSAVSALRNSDFTYIELNMQREGIELICHSNVIEPQVVKYDFDEIEYNEEEKHFQGLIHNLDTLLERDEMLEIILEDLRKLPHLKIIGRKIYRN